MNDNTKTEAEPVTTTEELAAANQAAAQTTAGDVSEATDDADTAIKPSDNAAQQDTAGQFSDPEDRSAA